MNNCETCNNAIFDHVWGEYKCKVTQHRIYEPMENIDCSDYKKKETKK